MHIMLVLFLCILGSGHRIVSDSYKWIEVMNKKTLGKYLIVTHFYTHN